MALFSRKRAAELADELSDHFKLIENVRALQTAQEDIAAAVAKLGEDVRRLETEMTALKSDVRYEAMKEAQSAVLAVQSGFNERLQEMALKVRDIEHQTGQIPQTDVELLPSGGSLPDGRRSKDNTES
jgi:cell fate (sporulation/competence/biofilm development) regulator YmcA (YheA/YmcA/DUF963 family)